MYEMMAGQPPFDGENETDLFDAILNDDIVFPAWMGSEAQHLLRRVCCSLGRMEVEGRERRRAIQCWRQGL